jgi:phosphomevalonate kinase
MLITASAPGKVVLSGEYAVLDGAPAICMAVDRRARVTISSSDDGHHSVTAPGFSDAHGLFKVENGEPIWLADGDEFGLVGDVWRTANATVPGSLSIVLDTREFVDAKSNVKFGVGSSAALTVALSAALCEIAATDSDAAGIAFAAHRQLQHGFGSGVDVACSSLGGLIEYSVGGGRGSQMAWPEGLAFGLLWSGASANTGAKLQQLDRSETQPSRAALSKASRRIANAWREGSVQSILDEYGDYTTVLRDFSIDHELGIFDAGHAELADAARVAGLVYKPCGAGGGDVGIVLAANDAEIATFVEQAKAGHFRALDMSIDRRGLQVDREEH